MRLRDLIADPVPGAVASFKSRAGRVMLAVQPCAHGIAVLVTPDTGVPVVRYFRDRREIASAWGVFTMG